MNDEFEQSRWFVKIRARIDLDGVGIREKGPLRSYETKIPFHQIPDDVVRFSNVPRLLLIVTIVFGLSFGYRVFLFATSPAAKAGPLLWSGLFFILAGLNLWAQSASVVGYLCGTGTIYFFDKSGVQDPSQFLRRIHEAKLDWFRRYQAAGEAQQNSPPVPSRRMDN